MEAVPPGEVTTTSRHAVYHGRDFKLFQSDQATVEHVLGEFYWRVAAGEEVATDDYVRPGWMLSREANGAEISWTLLELIDPRSTIDGSPARAQRRAVPSRATHRGTTRPAEL